MKYTTSTGRMAYVQWSIQPVQDVWLTYTAYSPRSQSTPYASLESMHQIWYSRYTKYILCIIGDIWSNVCTKFGTRSIRPVPGVWLTYNEVDNLYRTYGWLTQHIVRVHRVYSMYHRNVCTKFGARSLRPVPGLWLTYTEVYDVYRTYGWRTQRIVRAQQV